MTPVESKLFLWRESALYIGDSFDPDMHHHNAVQCCISLQGNMKIKSVSSPSWQNCKAVVVGANVKHQILNPEGPLCIVYLDKTSDVYRSILDFHKRRPVLGVSSESLILDIPASDCDAIQAACSVTLKSKKANELKTLCLQLFHGPLDEFKPMPMDPRVNLLLRSLHAQPERRLTGKELANMVCLSESRMQHIFKQEVGLPIRAYVLWVRVRHVLTLSLSGVNISTAAHASGFSDSSHFTRTFKSMFGITPSTLLSKAGGVNVRFFDSGNA